MTIENKIYPDSNDIKLDDKSEQKKESLKEKAKLSGCEMTDGQILFMLTEFEKERAFNLYLREKGLEFVNERTRESIAEDFENLIFNPENKDTPFDEILNSLVTDETGEFIWDLFTPESGKKSRLMIYGENSDSADASKILPACGNIDISDSAGINPFDKESWNMAAQSKIYKENPEIAKYLAAAARKQD
ncbi:MAG: hypothetical protein FWF92_02515 [Oscillospiraceae bacterium]|nr:hypothetical protein [Oscillospiraceae bacterium]